MRVEFEFPELPHPNSRDISIAELANIIEAKYGVIENFDKYIAEKFHKEIKRNFVRNKGIREITLSEWLKNQWREYIISGKAGFTIASKKRGDPGFVHTSSYYLGMKPKFVFDREERIKYVKR